MGSNREIHAAISGNNSIVLSLNSGSINYYTKAANGSYQVTQILTPPTSFMDVEICPNEEYIAVASSSNYLKLYQKTSGTFSFHSAESCSSGYPTQISFSHDCQWLVWACTNYDVKIFRNLPPFTSLQNLTNSDIVLKVAISTSTLLVSLNSIPIF